MASTRLKRNKGFTLIELLVVLTIITIGSTVVVPKLWGQYSQFREIQKLETFWSRVKASSVRARESGENYILEPGSKKLENLASEFDINITSGDVIISRADGFTKGGTLWVEISSSRHRWVIHVSTPDGHVRFERQ